jgi:hypothetical protein
MLLGLQRSSAKYLSLPTSPVTWLVTTAFLNEVHQRMANGAAVNLVPNPRRGAKLTGMQDVGFNKMYGDVGISVSRR